MFRISFFVLAFTLGFNTSADSELNYEAVAVNFDSGIQKRATRISTRSPWFFVTEKDVDLQYSYAAWDIKNERRVPNLQIYKKVISMVEEAEHTILASAFLFDCMYSDKPPLMDVVSGLTNLLVRKKKENPEMTIAFVLDSLNRSWSDRVSPAVQTLADNGIDIFYSDLLNTNGATRLRLFEGMLEAGRAMGIGEGPVSEFFRKIPLSVISDLTGKTLDGKKADVGMALTGLLLKANHRKLLVTDVDDTYETIVSSANPHNASLPSGNFGISIKGELAKYVYNATRLDIQHSMKIGARSVHWHTDAPESYKEKYLKETLPKLGVRIESKRPSAEKPVAVRFVTESKIMESIIDMLDRATGDDEVRINIFYLSNLPVINAILEAAARLNKSVRIIMDPNKDAFNSIKDGTPNRQVAWYLLDEARKGGLKLEVRWYNTHGEQDHSKIMSVTNKETGKYEILTGSSNWTRKNLEDINMEANVMVVGSKKLNLQHDRIFDMFWYNQFPGLEFTIDWDDPHFAYHKPAPMKKWSKIQYVTRPGRGKNGIRIRTPKLDRNGRPVRIENAYVAW